MEGRESKRFTVTWHESPAQEVTQRRSLLRLELQDVRKRNERIYKPAKIDHGGDHLMAKYMMPDDSDDDEEEPSSFTSPFFGGETEKHYPDEKTEGPSEESSTVSISSSLSRSDSSNETLQKTNLKTIANRQNRLKNWKTRKHATQKENSFQSSSSSAGITPRRSIALSRKLVESSSQMPSMNTNAISLANRGSTKRKQDTPSKILPSSTSANKEKVSPTLNSPLQKRARSHDSTNGSQEKIDDSSRNDDENVIVDTPVGKGRFNRLCPRNSLNKADRPSATSKVIPETEAAKISSPQTSRQDVEPIAVQIDSPSQIPETPKTARRVKTDFKRTHSTPNQGMAPDDLFNDSLEQYLSQIPLPPDCFSKRTTMETVTSPGDDSMFGSTRTPSSRTPFKRYRTYPDPSTTASPRQLEMEQSSAMKSTLSCNDSLDCILSDPDLLAAIDAKCASSFKNAES